MIHFDIEKLEGELKDLENKTLEADFWEDNNKSNVVLEKIKSHSLKLRIITFQ